jgi:hypothetical protein
MSKSQPVIHILAARFPKQRTQPKVEARQIQATTKNKSTPNQYQKFHSYPTIKNKPKIH